VERSPGVFEKRQVEIALSGPDDSYVSQGLSSGERVVVEGALLLNAEVEADAH
jgi:cobalt-zinc-cadmium efflux system membrane fusion protein